MVRLTKAFYKMEIFSLDEVQHSVSDVLEPECESNNFAYILLVSGFMWYC